MKNDKHSIEGLRCRHWACHQRFIVFGALEALADTMGGTCKGTNAKKHKKEA